MSQIPEVDNQSHHDGQDNLSTDEGFHTDHVVTIAGGHFVHDGYTAFLSPLLPILQERLSTNYALTGSLAIFVQLPSLLNPLIGYLADRMSLRYFVIFAPAVTATLISCLGFTSNYLSLALLLLAAGVSIAAFHAPAPAMIAEITGKRVGAGLSIFMASGELGRTIGPLAVAAGVSWFGLEGIWRLMFVGWAVSGILFWRLHTIAAKPRKKGANLLPWAKASRVFPSLTWIMLTRAFMIVALTSYLPLFMDDVLNVNFWLVAGSLTILEAAGVVGALFSGTLSDRFGRTRVLGLLLAISPFFLVIFLFSSTWLKVLMLLALGLTAISTTPVFLAIVQDEFPDQRALANGTFMALNFLVRALGIAVIGILADRIGLHSTFLVSAVVAFLALPALYFLPQRTQTRL